MSDTAFCEQCKGPIGASDRYCPTCGSAQTQVTAQGSVESPGAGPDAPTAVSPAQPASAQSTSAQPNPAQPTSAQPNPVGHTPQMQTPKASGNRASGGAVPPTRASAPGPHGQPTANRPKSISLESFSREEQILGGIAIFLAIDLLFLPWFEIGVESFSFSTTATQNPDGWLGVLAVLAALGLVADLAIERLSPHVHLPSLTQGRATTRLLLASAAAGCVALKFLFHIHFSLFGAGFWLAAALSIALVVFALRLHSTSMASGTAGG